MIVVFFILLWIMLGGLGVWIATPTYLDDWKKNRYNIGELVGVAALHGVLGVFGGLFFFFWAIFYRLGTRRLR